jgi:hypothetical protein
MQQNVRDVLVIGAGYLDEIGLTSLMPKSYAASHEGTSR